ncbi:Probable diphthine methyl ester synthase [Linum perenne]
MESPLSRLQSPIGRWWKRRPTRFCPTLVHPTSLSSSSVTPSDIRVKEPTWESLSRGKKKYEPPRYMTINTAIEQLLEVVQNREGSAYDEDTDCVGFARIGSEDQKIVAGTMKQLLSVDFGAPLHCLVITGQTHPLEEEMLRIYRQ